MPKYLLPATLLATSMIAFAAPAADIDLEHARALQERARELRADAEATYDATERACYEQFRVNRCLDEARQARLERIREARALEIEARRIELADKQRRAAEAGLQPPAHGAAPTEARPTAIVPSGDDAAAEAIRSQRAAEAAAAEARAQAERARRDAERAEARAKAEAAAARRAEKAARDRERYDERIRRRQAGD